MEHSQCECMRGGTIVCLLHVDVEHRSHGRADNKRRCCKRPLEYCQSVTLPCHHIAYSVSTIPLLSCGLTRSPLPTDSTIIRLVISFHINVSPLEGVTHFSPIARHLACNRSIIALSPSTGLRNVIQIHVRLRGSVRLCNGHCKCQGYEAENGDDKSLHVA